MSPEVQAIIKAWISGDIEAAISLTHLFRENQKRCVVCGKPLAVQAKGNYCKRHRHKNPVQKARVLASQSKSKGSTTRSE